MHLTMRIIVRLLLSVASAVGAVGFVHAQPAGPLQLGVPFQDHAVLQRDRPLVVWGTAAPGDRVTVIFNGTQATVTADASANWTATLPSQPAGGPYTLEVRTASGGATTLSDLLVGDVWLCSGQSNMELAMSTAKGGAMAAMRSNGATLRLLTVPHAAPARPASRFETAAAWKVATADAVRPFSAACYYFARELQKTVPVPMGLINASWGGSAAEPWISDGGLRGQAAFTERLDLLRLYSKDEDAAQQRMGAMWEQWLRSHGAAVGEPWSPKDTGEWTPVPEPMRNWKTWGVPVLAKHDGMVWFRRVFTLSAEQAARAASLSTGGIDEVDQTWVNGRVIRNTFGWGNERTYKLPKGTLQAGDNVVVINVLSTYDAGGMIGPADHINVSFDDGTKVPLGGSWRYRVVPLEMGRAPRAPWESVSGLTTMYNGMIAPLGRYGLRGAVWYQGETNADVPDGYQGVLASLMRSWREQFGMDLPFLIVQLPGYGAIPAKPVESNWSDVREAQRLAVAADAHAGLAVTIDLGEVEDIHPVRKLEVGARLARVARRVVYGETLAPSGPVPRAATRESGRIVVTFGDVDGTLVTYSSRQAIGFELCGAARESCRYASATADGNRVLLAVPAAEPPPTRVRFCWGNSPVCNLSDATGLPVVPFELSIR
jgi:sialate O-acetylesterase